MKKTITQEVKSLYDLNEWQLSKEKLIDIVSRIEKQIELNKYSEKNVKQFFLELSLGMIDNIYRNPLSLLNAFYKWNEEKKGVSLNPKDYL
jgi:hypothetical protein